MYYSFNIKRLQSKDFKQTLRSILIREIFVSYTSYIKDFFLLCFRRRSELFTISESGELGKNLIKEAKQQEERDYPQNNL